MLPSGLRQGETLWLLILFPLLLFAMDPLPHRRKKTARERREQKDRAEARTIGRLLKSCIALNTHRGCAPSSIHAALAKTLSASKHDANDEMEPDLEMVDQAELPDLIDLSDPVEWVPLAEPYNVVPRDIIRARNGFFLSYGNRDAFVPEGTIFSSSKVTWRGQTIQEVELTPQDCLALERHGHTRLIVTPANFKCLEVQRDRGWVGASSASFGG